MLQFPFPVPPPDFPIDPPGIVFQLFTCLLVVCLWLEMIVLVLPERWRRKVCEIQFGPRWAARTDRKREWLERNR
jgi:hypothetical protein